eukprot:gnl/TRDRNA2_/TRDRNA2_75333_c0_seq1.p2 gnl/TRDRNA2_/TRDRNA2_75333_c0~~gnl/TRDRNA2_/TRDRNA2_75333_c0_seq1.p2  ORF type:complete len:118 (-),score=9.61 gnl/TRDRNA2_/TRDRNA2_75333_c0_seq1:41-394(-)
MLHVTLWATSQLRVTDVWSLLDHAKEVGISFSPICFEVPLVECEQRGLYGHEVRLLTVMDDMACKHGAGGIFSAATKHVMAMALLQARVMQKLSHSDSLLGPAYVCMWCTCCGQESP